MKKPTLPSPPNRSWISRRKRSTGAAATKSPSTHSSTVELRSGARGFTDQPRTPPAVTSSTAPTRIKRSGSSAVLARNLFASSLKIFAAASNDAKNAASENKTLYSDDQLSTLSSREIEEASSANDAFTQSSKPSGSASRVSSSGVP